MLCGVWCVVCGVWCVVCGARYDQCAHIQCTVAVNTPDDVVVRAIPSLWCLLCVVRCVVCDVYFALFVLCGVRVYVGSVCRV
jgi:hypothetical protein